MARTLAELIRAAIDVELAELHCAIPGTIVSYDPALGFASVKPAVKRPVPSESDGYAFEDLPILQGVKVAFAFGPALTVPLNPGDGVLVVCSDYDAGQWLGTGQAGAAGQTRSHSLGYGFAVAGISTVPIAHAAFPAMVLEHTKIQLGAAAGPTDYVINRTKLIAAISGAATTPNDGGAGFKAALVTALQALTSKVVSE